MTQRTLLALSAVMLLSRLASAESWAEKLFETTTHDFGTIAREAKAEYKFVLKNPYLEDIHISGAQASCGCTKARVEKPLLKAYEEGAIVATINSHSFSGSQKGTITVTLDKPARATVRLHVEVYVEPNVVVEPGLVDFGDVEPGVPVEKTVSVRCTRGSDWRILDVKTANPHFSGTAVETNREKNRVSYELRVALDGKAAPGYIKEHLVLVTNDSKSDQIPVTVQGRVLAPIWVSPSSLFLGVVPSGEKVSKNLVVRSRKPFSIVSVAADCDCLEFPGLDDPAAKALHLLSVTFTASGEAGKMAQTIRIETDVDGAVAKVPVYAAVPAR
jgi:hypothetical protein